MARKAVATLLLIILGVAQLWATPKDSIPQHLSAEIRPDYNFISHHALHGAYTNGDALESALSAHLRYSFSLSKSNPLNEIYPTAYQGIGIGVYTLYHNNFTGIPIVAYLLQGARIADLTERLSLEAIKKIDIHAHATAFAQYAPAHPATGYRMVCAEEICRFYDALNIEKGVLLPIGGRREHHRPFGRGAGAAGYSSGGSSGGGG